MLLAGTKRSAGLDVPFLAEREHRGMAASLVIPPLPGA